MSETEQIYYELGQIKAEFQYNFSMNSKGYEFLSRRQDELHARLRVLKTPLYRTLNGEEE